MRAKAEKKPTKAKPADRPLSTSQKLDAVGIDAICERIEAGETYTEIAVSLGVSVGALHGWLNRDDARAEMSARARTASAEAWLDRGLDPLRAALDKGGNVDASAARAYAQECARRAAIRNPVYREKSQQDVTVEAGAGLLGVLAGLGK